MIAIDYDRCTLCRACFEVCPNFVLLPVEEGGGRRPSVAHPDLCNECGHCMAVCRPRAIHNDRFSYDDFQELGPSDVTTASLKDLLMSRRSVRRYTDRDVPEESMEELLDVAIHAGTGGNGQTVGFVIVRDKTLLGELEKLTLDTGWTALRHLDNETVMKALRAVAGAGRAAQLKRYHDVFKHRMDRGELQGAIFRDAPVVLMAHEDRRTPTGRENCAIALRNVEALALTMGLGSCWVGLFTFVAVKRHRKINPMLGLAPSRRVYGALMLGYPKYTRRMIVPRRDRAITRL